MPRAQLADNAYSLPSCTPKLTTKVTVNALIHIELHGAGSILHTSQLTPGQLRVRFAAALAHVAAIRRSTDAGHNTTEASVTGQVERRDALHRTGALNADEYNKAKAKILGT